MTVEIKALQEKRRKLAADLKAAMDGFEKDKRWETAEAEAQYREMCKDYDANQVELDKLVDEQRNADEVAEQRDKLEDDEKRSSYKGPVRPGSNSETDTRVDSTSDNDARLCLQAWIARSDDNDLTGEQEEACKRSGFNPNKSGIDIAWQRADSTPVWSVRNISDAIEAAT